MGKNYQQKVAALFKKENLTESQRAEKLERLRKQEVGEQERKCAKKVKQIQRKTKYTESQRSTKIANLEKNLMNKKKRLQEPALKGVGDVVKTFNHFYERAAGPSLDVEEQDAKILTNLEVPDVLYNRLKSYVTRIQEHPCKDDSDAEDGVMDVNRKFKAICETRSDWRSQYENIMNGEKNEKKNITKPKKKRKKKKSRKKRNQNAET